MLKQSPNKQNAGAALLILEMFMFTVVGAFRLSNWIGLDRRTTLITLTVVVATLSMFYFRSYFFRVITSIVFSLLWALSAFEVSELLTTSSLNRWLAFWVIFTIMLVIHKSFSYENSRI